MTAASGTEMHAAQGALNAREREEEEEEKSLPCRVNMAAGMEAIQKMTGYPSESSGYPLSAAEVAK